MNAVRRIDIRCDGNKRIASGHVKRCLTLARAFAEAGAQVRILVADEESAALAKDQGFPVVVLNTYYRALDREIPVLINEVKNNNTDFLLIDSYAVTREYLEKLREVVKTGYIDDLHSFVYPVDILLQYSSTGQPSERARGLASRCLLGTEYAPIRKEFSDPANRMPVRDEVRKILVTTGGSDTNHMAFRITQGFIDMGSAAFRDIELNVVVGRLSDDLPILRALAERDPRIVIHHDVRDMPRLMAASDLAMTAGGTTAFELCAVGVPSVMFVYSEDQARVLATLEGIVAEAGVATDAIGAEASAQAALKWAAKLSDPDNTDLRREYSEKMRSVTDGKGAQRVARIILDHISGYEV